MKDFLGTIKETYIITNLQILLISLYLHFWVLQNTPLQIGSQKPDTRTLWKIREIEGK